MPSYSLSILGQEISFKTNVGEKRIKEAEQFVKRRFQEMNTPENRLNNEKLLILLSLSLADELLQKSQELEQLEGRLSQLLEKIQEKTG
jgi:cell division protein ZapA